MNEVSLKLLIEHLADRVNTDGTAADWLQSETLNKRLVTTLKNLIVSNPESNETNELNSSLRYNSMELIKFVLDNGHKKG